MANEIVGLKIQVDSGEATKSVGSLKAQLREAQADVTKLSEKFGATSKEAVEAAKRAADLRDRIGDARALTDAFNPETEEYEDIRARVEFTLYVGRVEPFEADEYDQLLREVLSAALAADIAYAVTSSNPVATQMYSLYQEKLRDARFVDSTEGYNTDQEMGMASVVDSNTFINSRF